MGTGRQYDEEFKKLLIPQNRNSNNFPKARKYGIIKA